MSSERIRYVRDSYVTLQPFNGGCWCCIDVTAVRGVLRVDLNEPRSPRPLDAEAINALKELSDAVKRDGDFRSFKPKPKIRMIANLDEAKPLIGTEFKCRQGNRSIHEIETVGLKGIRTTRGEFVSYGVLYEQCTTLDGEPLGVKEG